jgi:CRISPR/Cas system-associated exonuclease Cas4 (RecB family)
MPVPRETPFVWTTWLPPLLNGDKHCEWAAWFRAHFAEYDQAPSEFKRADWKLDHTALLKDTRLRLERQGYRVFLEHKFTVRGRSGITLSGKPDIIATREDSNLIVDVKTGKRWDWHDIQVLIYMWAIPVRHPTFRGLTFDGRVLYKGQKRPVRIGSEEVTETFRKRVRELILLVGGNDPPRKTPSPYECRYCPIAASECPERVRCVEEDGNGELADF